MTVGETLAAAGLMRLRAGDWQMIYSETLVVLTIIKVSPRGSAHE